MPSLSLVLQIPLAALAGCILPSAALALTVNPMDRSLPLSIHARAGCADGPKSSGGFLIDDGALRAACSGSVVDSSATDSVFGVASGEVDLARGTLKAVATSRSLQDATQSLSAGASSTLFVYDTLTAEGSFTGLKAITLKLHVEGSFSSNASRPNWQGSSVNSVLITYDGAGVPTGGSGLFITQGNAGTPFITSMTTNVVGLTTNATSTVFDPADVQFDYSYTFLATPTNRTFSFMARLGLTSGMGFGTDANPAEGTIDFGHTARFSLEVPSDITVSSASGQFLAAVPEPGAHWLLLTGMAVVAARTAGWRRARGPTAL